MPQKKFDCVKMKHDIQKKILKELKSLTPEQKHKKDQKDIESDALLGPLVKRSAKR
jgi:hypothetical protein